MRFFIIIVIIIIAIAIGVTQGESSAARAKAKALEEAELYNKQYVGCWNDKIGPRDLPDFAKYDKKMSVKKCINKCIYLSFLAGRDNNNYTYAGLQSKYNCYCGSRYGIYGRSNDCNFECPGNEFQKCGGHWTNSVYSLSLLN